MERREFGSIVTFRAEKGLTLDEAIPPVRREVTFG
jgi:hypothetical protein